MTTISSGPTDNPTQGLRYRVVISCNRILDSAIIELALDNAVIAMGAVSSTAVVPFTITATKSFPHETRMENTVVTPLPDKQNHARVTADIIIPLKIYFTDKLGNHYHTHTVFTYKEDIVLFIPDNASFPYEITSEGTTDLSHGEADKKTATISKLCVRIITRVRANTDLLIPCYGYAPISPATLYEERTCKEFFNQPLFPHGKKGGN